MSIIKYVVIKYKAHGMVQGGGGGEILKKEC